MAHDDKGNAAALEAKAVQSIACALLGEGDGDLRLVGGVSQAAIDQNWAEVERRAAGALMALSVSEAGKKAVSQGCDGSVVVLRELIARKEQPATVTNATQAIRLASEYPPGRQRFVASLIDDTELLAQVGVHVFSKHNERAPFTPIPHENDHARNSAISLRCLASVH